MNELTFEEKNLLVIYNSAGTREGLIAALEDTFDIMMDTDDIIDFSSFEKGKEILAGNYDVEF